ncbi:yellow-g2b precursor [Nasonia vitripennis]|uniref:Bee-milk protein n=1 Tax=Nasonia vitripennis TaxID=7425 RepID=A0A7M6UVV1_NASVI|nr:yellow-g2b precursor [Nasonia vitripennis]
MWSLSLLSLIAALGIVAGYDAYSGEKPVCKNVKWTGGDSISWPCSTTKQLYKSSAKFVSKNMLATRVAVHNDNAYVAMPRFKSGIPFTLGKVNLKSKGCEANLAPFPCWSVQEEGNCAALQSAVDIFLDTNDILWVLDTGIVHSLDEPLRRCPPKVVAFNVKTGKLVKTVDLSPLATNTSRLQYVVADYAKNGHVFIYVSDAANRAILVFDVTSSRCYRVVLPRAVTFGCARRDVLTLALIHRPDGTGCLVFSYFGGKHIYSIKTCYLQNGSANGKVADIGPKRGKFVFLGTDNGTAIFFRREGESDIYRWDLLRCPTKNNIQKVYEGNKCELPTHVVPDYKRGRMRVLESNFPDYFQGTVGCGANHALNIF